MSDSRTQFKPFPEIIGELHLGHKTGRLEFTLEGHQYRIHFDKGSIAALESDRPEQTLSRRLLDSGAVSPGDVELVMSMARTSRGKKLGQVLVEMGILEKEALIRELNNKLKDSFTALFDLGRISYVFTDDPGDAEPWQIVPSATSADLILDGCRNMKSLLPATRMLQDPEAYLSISSDAAMIYQRASLSPLEKRVLQHLREPRRTRELMERIREDPQEFFKAVYGLINAGFLSLTREKPATPRIEPPPDHDLPARVTRREVVKKFSEIGTVSHYAFLDIAPDATADAVEEGFTQTASMYHPDHAVNESLSDLKNQLESIFLAAVRARNILTDARRRKTYDEEMARPKSGVSDSTQVRLSSAATHYQYAMKALSRRDMEDAVRSLLQAIENDPSNALYPFKMGQILKRLPTQQKEAEMYYKRALEMDPLNTEIILDLARLYARNNIKHKAEALCRQAIQIDPSNPEAQEQYERIHKTFTLPLAKVAYFLLGLLLGFFLGYALLK